MALMPLFTKGVHLTSIIVTPCTENAATGAVTEVTGSAEDFTGVIDSVSSGLRRNQEMIAPVNSLREHYENIMDGYDVRITEIQTRKTASAAGVKLPRLAAGWALWKIVVQRGGNTLTFYGRWNSLEDGITSAGKNTVTATITPVDTGGSVAPYSYV